MYRYGKRGRFLKFLYRLCHKKSTYKVAARADKKKKAAKRLELHLNDLKSTGKAFVLVDSPLGCYKLFEAIR